MCVVLYRKERQSLNNVMRGVENVQIIQFFLHSSEFFLHLKSSNYVHKFYKQKSKLTNESALMTSFSNGHKIFRTGTTHT